MQLCIAAFGEVPVSQWSRWRGKVIESFSQTVGAEFAALLLYISEERKEENPLKLNIIIY